MKRQTQIIIVVLGLVLIGLYTVNYSQVNRASEAIFDNATFVELRFEGLKVMPPSAKLVAVYRVFNPTGLRLIMSLNADVYIGDSYVANLTIANEVLEPHVSSDLEILVQLEAERIGPILNQGTGSEWSIEGKVTLTNLMFGFVPVTATRTGDITHR